MISEIWHLAFPHKHYRDRPLYTSCDLYGTHMGAMTFALTILDFSQLALTEALLDFYIEGRWAVLTRKIGDRQDVQFRFTHETDADMFRLFGIPGVVTPL